MVDIIFAWSVRLGGVGLVDRRSGGAEPGQKNTATGSASMIYDFDKSEFHAEVNLNTGQVLRRSVSVVERMNARGDSCAELTKFEAKAFVEEDMQPWMKEVLGDKPAEGRLHDSSSIVVAMLLTSCATAECSATVVVQRTGTT